MARKNIFIASAWETQEIAAKIARALADRGYSPLRWWEQFPGGSLTLDRLREIAKREADGAVLLLTKVDKTWYREKSSEAPRDNVVLEFGLFVSALDRDRTLILSDGARLPSDTAGITLERLVDDVSTAAERVVKHFDRIFENPLPPPQEILLIADNVIVDQLIKDPLPDDWHTRDCYFGAEGAKAWLGATGDTSYEPESQQRALRKILLRAVDKIDVRTFVSFGPGDASQDEELVIRLRNNEPWLQYIPIDISDGLLHRAISRMKEQVRVPVGILGDFEERLGFITRTLRDYATPPLLLALLGNTLGNLDRFEERFLRGIRGIMRAGDCILLDISLAGPKWALSSDRRGHHAGYGEGYRRFIATGVSRRHGCSVESVFRNFEQRIHFSAPHERSDIPNTNTIFITFREDGQASGRLVYSIRRYDWDTVCNWLEQTLNLKVEFSEKVFIDDMIGDGVVLLKAV